jgi:UDP-glucuronate 4-epimerase
MTILVTGVAGFIGMHVAHMLLSRGDAVIGIDSLNDYYDPALKKARLAELETFEGFTFHRCDISDATKVERILDGCPALDRVVHLAAQAGVRHSLVDPHAYVTANVTGHLVILEACRARASQIRHLVYASSSSVYGANTKLPFAETDVVDAPMSLYAATKRADELMSRAYVSLFGVPMTGLRFFTVYGPWGRPDMAVWAFTEAILRGTPLSVVDGGRVARDFTYIDDIVAGVVAALDRPPRDAEGHAGHAIFNLGNKQPETLLTLIKLIEDAAGKPAGIVSTAPPPGDVPCTWAETTSAEEALQFRAQIPLASGVRRFVEWYQWWSARNING